MSPSSTPHRYEWKDGFPRQIEEPKPPFLFEPEWITYWTWVCAWSACLFLLGSILVGCGADGDDSPSSPVAPHPDDLTECDQFLHCESEQLRLDVACSESNSVLVMRRNALLSGACWLEH